MPFRWVLGEATAKSGVVVRGCTHSVNAAPPPVGYLSTRRAPAGHSTRRVRTCASRREDRVRASGSLPRASGGRLGRWAGVRLGPLGYPYGAGYRWAAAAAAPAPLGPCLMHPTASLPIPWGFHPFPSLPIPMRPARRTRGAPVGLMAYSSLLARLPARSGTRYSRLSPLSVAIKKI